MKNSIALEEKWVTLLKKDFSPLEEIQKGISEKILKYILDDEGAAILSQLKSLKNVDKHYGLRYTNYSLEFKRDPFRKEFFKGAVSDDPSFYYRLAQVYFALFHAKSSLSYTTYLVKDLQWIKLFLADIGRENDKVHFDFQMMEKVLEYAEVSPDILMKEVFLPEKMNPYDYRDNVIITNLKGFVKAVPRYSDIVKKGLNHKKADIKVNALNIFKEYKIDIKPFILDIVKLAVSSSKTVRSAAMLIPLKDDPSTKGHLENIVLHGKSDEKIQAVMLLVNFYQQGSLSFLKEQLKNSSSEKLIKVIKDQVQNLERIDHEKGAPSQIIELPALPEIKINQPLSEDAKKYFHECRNLYNKEIMKFHQGEQKYSKSTPEDDGFINDSISKKVVEAMERLVVDSKVKIIKNKYLNFNALNKLFRFFIHKDVTLIHAVRLCIVCIGYDGKNIKYLFSGIIRSLETYRRCKSYNLRELGHVFKTIGFDPRLIGIEYIIQYSWGWQHNPLFKMSDENIWAYFYENMVLLEECLGLVSQKIITELLNNASGKSKNAYGNLDNMKINALRALSSFPVIPSHFYPSLWDFAFQGQQIERGYARKCLEKTDAFQDRIIEYLKSGNQEIRLRASQWLKEVDYKNAVPAIKEALSKEKHEKIKASYMETLEKLGVPANEFISIDELLNESKKNLAKGLPEKMNWFPWDQLPVMHWSDSGREIELDIIKWFLVRSYQLKNPEPDPAMKIYCSYFNKNDASNLALFILNSWIHYDTIPKYAYEEALDLAIKDTEQIKKQVKKYPDYYKNWDEKAHQNAVLRNYQNTCAGSANDFKGILAISAACGDPKSIKPSYDYIKKWFGYRAAQSKALIQVLAWIDDPMAIQMLLSIGRRFRTKSIQEEAQKQISAIAAKKGWSTEELADRTVPTAGLDENGTMLLDYGSRTFTVQLDSEMKLILLKEDGTQIKSLPEPNKADDQDKSNEAKKTFSDTNKELKQILSLQKERLYDSLCVQRKWRFSEWNEYLNQHTIVSRFCQKLVWAVFEGDRLVKTFRPLADHTLTDFNDDAVTLEDSSEIRLVHDIYLSDEEKNKWIAHFSDYKIEPLFPQIGKEFYHLPDNKKDQTCIEDFKGYMLQSFALRNVVTKLGYTRGEAEDAGFFYAYKKVFQTLGIQAMIIFTGNVLPEENRQVALVELCFEKISQGDDDFRELLQLNDVPPVLLSECWNDMKSAADAGSGFDSEWEKKSEF